MHKTILITGCSSGLGLSMVKILLANHWRVIATARNLEASDELKTLDHPLLIKLKLDIADNSDRQQIKNYIDKELNGELDCLINNAGYGLFGALEELTEEQIRHQLEVNLLGVIFLTQICLPALRKNRGKIINVSSVLGYFVFPLQSLYVTSKFALEGLTETLHYELEPHGVQVALIEPGTYQTRFGKNAKSALPQNSINEYKQQNENLSKFRAKLANRINGSPNDFALCILKLLAQPKMPLRKRIGIDANFIYYLRRFLPASIFNLIVKFIYKRIFQATI